MTRRGRRGGKGRGRSKVEGIRDNVAVTSSLSINPPQRPTLDQPSQLQAQSTRIPETSQRASLDLRSHFSDNQLPVSNQQNNKSQLEITGRGRRGGKGRGRGKVEGIRDNVAVTSSLSINPPQRPALDQEYQPQALSTRIPGTSQRASPDLRSHFSDNHLPESNQQNNKSQLEITGRGRRGGKGRGCGKVEGIRDNFAVASSLNISTPQGPTLYEASQPQAQPTGIPGTSQRASLNLRSHFSDNQFPEPNQLTNKFQREMTGSARGRGMRGGKGRGRGNVEGIRDNFAVASSLNINPPQRPTPDQASQLPMVIPEANSLNFRSPETSQGPSSGSQLSRNLEGSAHPSLDNLIEKLISGAVSCSNSRKGRGKYRSRNVEEKTKYGSKIRVDIPDDIDRAVGPGARNLVNYCGLVMRSTISFRDGDKWAKILAKHGEEMWLKVKEKFEVGGDRGEHKLQGFVISTMQRLFRTWKTRLHAEYSRYNTDEERLSNPPKDVMLEEWKFLVQLFGSEAFKARSERNKLNRQMQRTKHSCGSKSFAEVEESMRNPLTGEKASPDRVWELQHTRKNEKGELVWLDPQAQQIHAQIQELVAQQQYEENENRMTGDEILATVLGERTGYVRGKGYGKNPPRKSHMQQPDFGSSLSSAIESVRQEMQADLERKLQEEREQIRAEMEKRFQDQMEEERRQMRVEMDKRIIDSMTTLVVRLQQQGQSSSTARVNQGKNQKNAEVSWGVKRKRNVS